MREYRVWRKDEEQALRQGVAKHGSGAWELIRTDPEFHSKLKDRSGVQLKDKWRNLVKFNHLSPEELRSCSGTVARTRNGLRQRRSTRTTSPASRSPRPETRSEDTGQDQKSEPTEKPDRKLLLSVVQLRDRLKRSGEASRSGDSDTVKVVEEVIGCIRDALQSQKALRVPAAAFRACPPALQDLLAHFCKPTPEDPSSQNAPAGRTSSSTTTPADTPAPAASSAAACRHPITSSAARSVSHVQREEAPVKVEVQFSAPAPVSTGATAARKERAGGVPAERTTGLPRTYCAGSDCKGPLGKRGRHTSEAGMAPQPHSVQHAASILHPCTLAAPLKHINPAAALVGRFLAHPDPRGVSTSSHCAPMHMGRPPRAHHGSDGVTAASGHWHAAHSMHSSSTEMWLGADGGAAAQGVVLREGADSASEDSAGDGDEDFLHELYTSCHDCFTGGQQCTDTTRQLESVFRMSGPCGRFRPPIQPPPKCPSPYLAPTRLSAPQIPDVLPPALNTPRVEAPTSSPSAAATTGSPWAPGSHMHATTAPTSSQGGPPTKMMRRSSVATGGTMDMTGDAVAMVTPRSSPCSSTPTHATNALTSDSAMPTSFVAPCPWPQQRGMPSMPKATGSGQPHMHAPSSGTITPKAQGSHPVSSSSPPATSPRSNDGGPSATPFLMSRDSSITEATMVEHSRSLHSEPSRSLRSEISAGQGSDWHSRSLAAPARSGLSTIMGLLPHLPHGCQPNVQVPYGAAMHACLVSTVSNIAVAPARGHCDTYGVDTPAPGGDGGTNTGWRLLPHSGALLTAAATTGLRSAPSTVDGGACMADLPGDAIDAPAAANCFSGGLQSVIDSLVDFETEYGRPEGDDMFTCGRTHRLA